MARAVDPKLADERARMTALPAAEVPPSEPLPLAAMSVRTVVAGAAPRLVRDAFGPLAVFFAGWKLIGLTAGIGMAVLFGVSVFVHERRQGRPAVVVRLALLLVAIRAIVGLSSGSATVYLAQEIGIDVLLASAVLASLATARPFASWFAADVFPLPPRCASPRRSHTRCASSRSCGGSTSWPGRSFA